MGEIKKFEIPEGYEFDKVENGEVILKKKEIKLPKTWRDCASVFENAEYLSEGRVEIGWIKDETVDDGCKDFIPTGLGKPMLAFCQLLICRNAWWKLLEWKPDWEDNGVKYCIGMNENEIKKSQSAFANYILAFPTDEVRNQFLETFRDLIEEAKELL